MRQQLHRAGRCEMKRAIMGAVLVSALNSPALADDVEVPVAFRNPVAATSTSSADRAADMLLVAQLADAVSTRTMLRNPRAFERNPILRPFVRSDAGAMGVVLVTNALARLAFRHAPIVLDGLAALEAGCFVNNLRVMAK
jgi:hypothetical protein